MAATQNLNPPQSPLARGEAGSDYSKDSSDSSNKAKQPESSLKLATGTNTSPFVRKMAPIAPPLTRGGREGFAFLPYDKKLTALARENRKNPTAAEQKMWHEILSRHQFSAYKFLRQKLIQHFIVDFYCAKLGWVIEIDGDSHAEQRGYDENRTVLLQRHGLTMIRYDNRDVLNNIAGVYDDLAGRLG
ncbi:MAG: endonuclease domain-containing protein [Gallionella sp.]|nr:endonuclease domain-containing protein [Gallionella sp.]